MGDPAPAGKVVDLTAARDGAVKGMPSENLWQDKQAGKVKDATKPRRDRPARADKAASDKAKPQPRDKISQTKNLLHRKQKEQALLLKRGTPPVVKSYTRL